MNKTAATEWLVKGWHHLSTAHILYQCNHYTDIIGVELHYSIEIFFKSILAYDNKQIKKTHELYDLYITVNDLVNLNDDEIALLLIATKYHILEAYPSPHKNLPSKDEIKKVLDLADWLFNHICKVVDIPIDDIKAQ
jgi:HEPN domain-containing protein